MSNEVTRLLQDWHDGNEAARDRLWPLMYEELRRLALYHMNDQAAGHTLQATALVNEAFLKLVDADYTATNKRVFFALAAKAMRSILIDHARARGREKRGGNAARVTLVEELTPTGEDLESLIDLDQVLGDLASRDQRKADIVEMRLFGGLTFDEIAETLGLSNATVRSEMRFARAWLEARLAAQSEGGSQA
jgi:RNA polymerase sigma factor (TIGR02999 family)